MWKILAKPKSERSPGSAAALESLLVEQDLPHLPKAASSLLQLLRDPNATSEKIADVAQWDPGLVVRILRTVNSASVGARHEIRSIPHAVTFLGRGQLESLVLGLAIRDLLPAKSSPHFDIDRFWRTAGWRAALSRALSKRLSPQRADEHFLCGLLQDLGLPILARAVPDQYDSILSAWLGDPQVQLHEIERESFGWDHSQAGGHIARHFELPRSICEMITDHHDHDREAGGHPSVDLVAYLREDESDTGAELLVRKAVSHYGLSQPWVEELIQVAREQGRELAELMS